MDNKLPVNIELKDYQNDTLTILHGEKTVPEPYVFNGRRHRLQTVGSFIDFIKKRGNKDVTLLFCDGSRKTFSAILDDLSVYYESRRINPDARPWDKVFCDLVSSDEFKEWSSLLQPSSVSQKDFVKFIENRREFELSNREELLVTIRNLSFASEIKGEAVYEDEGNIGYVFKIQDKENMAKLPKKIVASIPIFQDGKSFDVEFKLEFIIPKAEDQKPAFRFECPRSAQYIREAFEFEYQTLCKELPEYTIMFGSID